MTSWNASVRKLRPITDIFMSYLFSLVSLAGKLWPVLLYWTWPTEWTGKPVKSQKTRKSRWPPLSERNFNHSTSTWPRVMTKIINRKQLVVVAFASVFYTAVFSSPCMRTMQTQEAYSRPPHCVKMSRDEDARRYCVTKTGRKSSCRIATCCVFSGVLLKFRTCIQ